MRAGEQRGFTLVELIVAFTIMALLTSMSVPLARYKVRRDQERELRYALREIRKAIDDYYADKQKYPDSLQTLKSDRVGVAAAGSRVPVYGGQLVTDGLARRGTADASGERPRRSSATANVAQHHIRVEYQCRIVVCTDLDDLAIQHRLCFAARSRAGASSSAAVDRPR